MKLYAQRWLTGMAALALAASVGCGRDHNDEAAAHPAGTVSPAQTGSVTTDNPDWWTTTKVQAKFFSDDIVKGWNIDVTTNAGVVSLTGTVDTGTAKNRAIELARNIEGVSSVQDHLQIGTPEAKPTEPKATESKEGAAVATSGRTEDTVRPAWITTKIQAQYFADTDVKPWNIDVTTMSNGAVTLSGTVDDDNDRTKAGTIARNTEGVSAVDNRLRVRGEKESGSAEAAAGVPDTWVTAKIQSKYFMDDEVKGRNINVDTKDGVVTLAGTVETEAQRAQAAAIARNTDGVKDLHEQLRVEPAAAPREADTARPQPNVVDNDAWITTKVRSRFFTDSHVKNMNVDVTTQNGVVTLSGEVENAEARTTAEAVAKQIEGVKQVTNRLTVKAQP